MPATALQSIEADLDRLERQRVGYALALASSQDERTRTRHERTLLRLDEEIAALQGAAAELVGAELATRGTASGVPIVDRTAEFTAEEYDELTATQRRRWLWPAVGSAVVVALGMIWLLSRPAPAPAAPAVAPASVIITSPVPPDSHR